MNGHCHPAKCGQQQQTLYIQLKTIKKIQVHGLINRKLFGKAVFIINFFQPNSSLISLRAWFNCRIIRAISLL